MPPTPVRGAGSWARIAAARRRDALQRGFIQAVLIDPFLKRAVAVQLPVKQDQDRNVVMDDVELINSLLGIRELTAMLPAGNIEEMADAIPPRGFSLVPTGTAGPVVDEETVSGYQQCIIYPLMRNISAVTVPAFSYSFRDAAGQPMQTYYKGRALAYKTVLAPTGGSAPVNLTPEDVRPLIQWHPAGITYSYYVNEVVDKAKPVCVKCGQKGRLKTCTKCMMAKYCSKECQLADRPSHRGACNLTSALL